MKPSGVILDLLRTYQQRGTSARNIMATGKMFGFNENAMRVNLSRLTSRDIIENFKRGHYRLTSGTDPINEFIEAWRQGEQRCRVWDEQCYCLLTLSDATDKDSWVFSSTGFVPVAASVWARPDNLSLSHKQLEHRLHQLGLSESGILATGARLSPGVEAACWSRYDLLTLQASYISTRRQLQSSLLHLREIPVEQAMKESFNLGGAAIQLLAKDPLLPPQMLNPENRVNLWQAMLEYDRVGRDIWASDERESPSVMPTSMASYA
jgi:phenylacetic acid degradation operon negative regulatory protein